MCLKELREKFNLSIQEVSITTGVPIRTYKRYEADENYGDTLKRKMIESILIDKYEITESKGMLNMSLIKNICENVFKSYNSKIDFCYLFGSYAKGYAKENSDVDLFISTSLSGFDFVGLIEVLRKALHKKVDLIRFNNLENKELLFEILKDGIKIYG